MDIEVCERLMDYFYASDGTRLPKYHACIAGEAGYWACGRTVESALLELLRNHPEKITGGRESMNVTYLGVLAR